MINLVERTTRFVARRWVVLMNLNLALVLAGAVAVSYLRSIGVEWLAEPLASAYLLICSQRPSHSYFPFGYQMALEQRMVAIFAAQLLGGLAFSRLRHRLQPLDWRLMVLLSLPFTWDVFSQTFGLRDSDWLWRTWTGALFNLALTWFAYPRFERGLAEAVETWTEYRQSRKARSAMVTRTSEPI